MSPASSSIPVATYRLQLTPSFGFAKAARVIPYLRALGVSDLYVSPIMQARRGSQHGYDIVDPTRLDAERGGEAGFRRLERALLRGGLRLVVDLVPHHLAAHESNPWWWDLLAKGHPSRFRSWFELDDPGDVVLPILSRPYGDALARGELRIGRRGSGSVVRYRDRILPLGSASWKSSMGRSRPTPGDLRATNADRERLHALLSAQPYRLVWWRVANEEVNYRRFFDISDLVGMRVDDPDVFAATHRLALGLAGRPAVSGFRIDHIDGLRDPEGYLQRLRRRAPRAVVYVEKILGPGERLPSSWDTEGTTGYEFLNLLGGLAIDPRGFDRLRSAYALFTGIDDDPSTMIAKGKRDALERLFAADVDRVLAALIPIARAAPQGCDLTVDLLRRTLVEITVALNVYRTYGRRNLLTRADRARITAAARRAEEELVRAADGRNAHAGAADARRSVRFVRRALIGDVPGTTAELIARWQQLTGPAMAKGFEDTALYRWVPLAAVNEVGGWPDRPAVSPDVLHREMRTRASRWPHALSATSTHDTKRGEDVRSRLAVLSEIPTSFARAVARWHRMTAPYRSGDAPSAEEEWLAYQTILGAWDGRRAGFARRVQDYMIKAAREAKVHTSWLLPDIEHERALRRYVAGALSDDRVVAELDTFASRLAWHGAIGSLASVVVRTAAPGVPDLYQGSESWNLSLVDPDNRRPVDFDRLRRTLARIDTEDRRDRDALIVRLLGTWLDGQVKLFATSRALRFRAAHATLFREGSYLPVDARGSGSHAVVSFARRRAGTWALAVVPRLTVSLRRLPPGWAVPLRIAPGAWGATTLALPRGAPAMWRDGFTGRHLRARGGRLRVADLLAVFPVALLAAESPGKRRR